MAQNDGNKVVVHHRGMNGDELQTDLSPSPKHKSGHSTPLRRVNSEPATLAQNERSLSFNRAQLRTVYVPSGIGENRTAGETEIIVNYHTLLHTLTLLQRDELLQGRKIAEIPAEVSGIVSEEDLRADFHQVPIETLEQRYKTSVNEGLPDDGSKATKGQNVITPPKKPSYIWLFLQQMVFGFNGALCIAAVLGGISYQPIGSLNGATPSVTTFAVTILIVIVIIVTSVFNFYQEFAANQIVNSLATLQTQICNVRRNGKWIDCPSNDLRVGDVVSVTLGTKVPADIRLCECNNLKVDMSALTGESEPIHCTTENTSPNFMESHNMAFLGTNVMEGSGNGIVVAVGDKTMMGKIGRLTNAKKKVAGSLKREIINFVWTVLLIGTCCAIASVSAWGAWLYQRYPTYITVSGILQILLSFIVAFVPEGLPVAVTVLLGITARRMYDVNVLVKDLTTVETFNTITMLASDKTGTLTQNKMHVVNVVPYNSEKEPVERSDPEKVWGSGAENGYGRENIHLLQLSMLLCNGSAPADAAEVDEGHKSKKGNKDVKIDVDAPVIKGDASDTAIYNFTSKYESVMQFRATHKRLHMLPFNSKNKYMTSINKVQQPIEGLSDSKENIIMFLKGAPDIVMKRCSRVIDNSSGQIRDVTDAERNSWQKQQTVLGDRGERVLGFSCLLLKQSEYPESYQFKVDDEGKANYPTDGLIFLGMVSLMDPPKLEVPDALKKCKMAHIRIAMVTGDHPSTAVAIAKQIGLVDYSDVDRLESVKSKDGKQIIKCTSNGRLIGIHRSTQTHLGNAATDQTVRTVIEDNNFKKAQIFELVESNSNDRDTEQTMSLENINMALQDNQSHNAGNSVKRPLSLASNGVSVDADDALRHSAPHAERLERALVVSGAEIELFDHALWGWVLRHNQLVFARTTPEQKLRIVAEAQARGESVGVTGDGVNDAPALRRANLGIAMQSGSEVAREAGHMILLDNNFSSIIEGIELGRIMFDNLRKVCCYCLPAGTFSEALTVLAQVFLGIPQPLGSFYFIIICVFTDVFMSTALMFETAESDIMTRLPRVIGRDKLVDWKLFVHAWFVIGVIHSIGAWTVFFWYLNDRGLPPHALIFAFDKFPINDPTVFYYGIDGATCNFYLSRANALFFTTLVLSQIGNLLATRTRRSSLFQHNPFWGPHQNIRIPIGVTLAIATVCFVNFIPWFQTTFQTNYAELPYALAGLGFGGFVFTFDETRKYIVRNHPESWVAKAAW